MPGFPLIARRRPLIEVIVVALALHAPSEGQAQAVAQTLTFATGAINQIVFTGGASLRIVTAKAGSAPRSVTKATARWAVTTNQSGAKITASVPLALPPGITLSARLAPPAGAASSGFRPLGTIAVDLVTGITRVAQSSLVVSYRLDATVAAGVIASTTRTITYTITGGS